MVLILSQNEQTVILLFYFMGFRPSGLQFAIKNPSSLLTDNFQTVSLYSEGWEYSELEFNVSHLYGCETPTLIRFLLRQGVSVQYLFCQARQGTDSTRVYCLLAETRQLHFQGCFKCLHIPFLFSICFLEYISSQNWLNSNHQRTSVQTL